jgi:hypothetical protein
MWRKWWYPRSDFEAFLFDLGEVSRWVTCMPRLVASPSMSAMSKAVECSYSHLLVLGWPGFGTGERCLSAAVWAIARVSSILMIVPISPGT